MFKLLPQFVVLASLIIIIVIVLRRIPSIIIPPETSSSTPSLRFSSRVRQIWIRARRALIRAFQVTLAYLHAAKDHTVKAEYLGRFSKTLRLGAIKSTFRLPAAAAPFIPLKERRFLREKEGGEDTERNLLVRIQKNPADQEAYESLGQLYLDKGQYPDAAEVFEFLTLHYPGQDTYFSKLGMARFNLAKYESAITAYEKAIQIRPDLPNRLVNLGLCYEALGQLNRAIEVLNKALAVSPENVQYLQLLADLLTEAQDKIAAIGVLEKILELEPTDHRAREKLMRLKF